MAKHHVVLILAATASMATSQHGEEIPTISSPDLEQAQIDVGPEGPSVTQHFRLFANAEAATVAAENSRLTVSGSFSGILELNETCENAFIVRVVPDQADLLVIEDRILVGDYSDGYFNSSWTQPFLSCTGPDACEDGATVEVEWDAANNCEHYSSVVIDWSVYVETSFSEFPAGAALDIQAD